MLIRLQRLIQQSEPSFIDALAGDGDAADPDAGDAADGGARQPGAGSQPPPAGGAAAAGSSGAPGAAPSAGGGGPAGDGRGDQTSNLATALREERAARKQLEQRLAALEAQPKPAAPAVETPPEPDFLEDPKGVIDKLAKRLDESEKQRKEREESEAKQREQQAKAQENWNKVLTAEAEFSAKTPDYQQALGHIRGILTEQIRLANPDATDQQIAQHIQMQEAQGAMHILAQGRNPSEVYYQYAQKLGYKPAAAPVANGQAGQQQFSARPDKEAVRSMGSGGGDGLPSDEPTGRRSGLPELGAAHAELKEERKKNARTRG